MKLLSVSLAVALLCACSTTTRPIDARAEDAAEHGGRADDAVKSRGRVENDERHGEAAKIRVMAVGDIMMGTDYPEDWLPPGDGREQLSRVRNLLRSGDITFGNLEGAMADGVAPAKVCKDPASCYLFRTPTRFGRALEDAGFDVMSLANNHARDFSESGRDSSKRTLARLSIHESGREGDVARWEVRGRKVALIAFAPNPGSNSLLDIEAAAAKVRRLAAESDLVFVSFHGGGEGADRTHVVRGVEELPPQENLWAYSGSGSFPSA